MTRSSPTLQPLPSLDHALADDRPAPAVYAVGSERVVVSFVAPGALSLVYQAPQATISTRSPLPFASLRPARDGAPALVQALELSPAMRTAVQGELLAVTRPTSPLAAAFFDAQRHIFVDSFTCDPMDEDALVKRPT